MIIFNDPVPLPDPAMAAVRMAIDMRAAVDRLAREWRRSGYELGCGIGVAQGYATIGALGVARWFDANIPDELRASSGAFAA